MRYLLILLVISLAACQPNYSPKPIAYPKIDLPTKVYQTYQSATCPYQFEYPTYARIIQDSFFFDEPTENPCWLNIDFTNLSGTVHISYKPITSEKTLQELVDDSYTLAFKHSKRANYIDEQRVQHNNAEGVWYRVGGNAASAIQFFLIDTSYQHFLRGALYFNSSPNADSLQPVIDFVEDDLLHMLETFEWR